jgi:hypothetical protein
MTRKRFCIATHYVRIFIILGAINVGANYNTISIVADANQFVWGIPTYDININTNLVQNTGW